MSIKSSSPRLHGSKPPVRSALRWPAPDTLVLVLLLVIAMVGAALVGLALGGL
jgi:hypothetical protein